MNVVVPRVGDADLPQKRVPAVFKLGVDHVQVQQGADGEEPSGEEVCDATQQEKCCVQGKQYQLNINQIRVRYQSGGVKTG